MNNVDLITLDQLDWFQETQNTQETGCTWDIPEPDGWLTEISPQETMTVPVTQEEDPQETLPSVLRWRRNLKKGKCPHGYRFFHAEAECWSCNLETIQLDKEFLEAKKSKALDNDPQDPDPQPEPEQDLQPEDLQDSQPDLEPDTCVHGVPINPDLRCGECIAPIGKTESEPNSESELTPEQAPEDTQAKAQVGDWLRTVIEQLHPLNPRPKDPPRKKGKNRRNSTLIQDKNLNLQEFGPKPSNKLPKKPWAPKHGVQQAVNFVQILQEESPPGPSKESNHTGLVFKKISRDSQIKIPQKKHNSDAGYDLQSTETVKIPPGGIMLIKTGLSCEIPTGYFGLLKARSSLAIAGISVEGGVIDSGYEGEILAILVNRNLERPITI